MVGSDASGQLDLAGLERAIGPRTKLIAITHVPAQGGLLNPAAEIGRIARATVSFICSMPASQLAVDVQEIGCRMLAAPRPHIFARPRGTAYLRAAIGYAELGKVAGLSARQFFEPLVPGFVPTTTAAWTCRLRERFELGTRARARPAF